MVDKAKWDEEGNPMNLLAAAENAYAWMVVFTPQSEKLRAARKELRKFLDEAEAEND